MISFLLEWILILHLFIREDYKTVMLPVSILSYFATPHTDALHFARALLWMFLNLLYFCICNQLFDPEEDRINKPFRPIPSGKISIPGANRLRWCVLPLCLGSSALWGVLPQCIILLALGSWYNQGNLGKHWFGRQGSVAIMYGAFNSGAAIVAFPIDPLDPQYLLRHALNTIIIFTTIQAADFRDTLGDAERGRVTLPILFPQLSRFLMPFILLAWSILICSISELTGTAFMLAQGVFVLSGLLTGMRFPLMQSPKEDRASYLWYDVSWSLLSFDCDFHLFISLFPLSQTPRSRS
ncbi:hypothetical protein DL93DRAFT_2058333 [Clavulina sp. PMI_390]|nr:hypothetical protein DL93DRAFT_2058333 [Clavulina sp. PMI_390]